MLVAAAAAASPQLTHRSQSSINRLSVVIQNVRQLQRLHGRWRQLQMQWMTYRTSLLCTCLSRCWQLLLFINRLFPAIILTTAVCVIIADNKSLEKCYYCTKFSLACGLYVLAFCEILLQKQTYRPTQFYLFCISRTIVKLKVSVIIRLYVALTRQNFRITVVWPTLSRNLTQNNCVEMEIGKSLWFCILNSCWLILVLRLK